MKIFIPAAREFRLIPLQVELIRKFIPGCPITIVETAPGASWLDSGGPWRLNRDIVAKYDLGLIMTPYSPEFAMPPRGRIAAIFDWLRLKIIPKQDDRVMVLSSDLLPVKPIEDNLFGSYTGAYRDWFTYCWFAMEPHSTDYMMWKGYPAFKRDDGMEDVWPGFLHVDKICTNDNKDIDVRLALAANMFQYELPSVESVTETIQFNKVELSISVHELRWLINSSEFMSRLPQELKNRIQLLQAGCGCTWGDRMQMVLPDLRPYLPQ
jgi:hypothetical protein